MVQRAAGANLSVDCNASTGNGALVLGDAVTSQGLYYVAPHSAVINEAITAADVTNPRVDRCILEIKDDTHDAGGLNLARVRIVDGTATAGATLDNLSGAAAVPSSAILLADIHVPASDTTISNSQIRDRRPWARGAYWDYTRIAGDYSLVQTTMTIVDSTNINPRIECSGKPLQIDLVGSLANGSADQWTDLAWYMDGALLSGRTVEHVNAATAPYTAANAFARYTPSAGSHRFALYAASQSATAVLQGDATYGLTVSIREEVRQNTANNATTSG